jgi:hypothetical protein
MRQYAGTACIIFMNSQRRRATFGTNALTCSVRIFVVGQDNTLCRLAVTKFGAMLDDPVNHRLPRFADQRVRMVSATVELRDRLPYQIARLVFQMLKFDRQGTLDRSAFERQNVALMELTVDRVVGEPAPIGTAVVDATSRFIAQGGQWQPSPTLEHRICQAALGEVKCERL